MGFFDFFKKKREPKMPEALAKFYKLFFPKGTEEQKRLTNELCKKLGNKYDYNVVVNNYIFVLSCLFLDEDKRASAIIEKVRNRRNNCFSKDEILVVYNHAVENNEQLSKTIGLLTLMDEMCQQGTSEDEMPGGFGDFGLCVTNPIPIHGVPENEVYLRKLRLLNGETISWKRLGSCNAKNIPHIIDNYEIYNKSGAVICHLYLCPYNKKTSTKLPKGFIFEGQISSKPEPQTLNGKILPKKNSSYVVDDNGEPMIVYYRQTSRLFVDKPTSSDKNGYFLNIRCPLLIDVTGLDRIDLPTIPTECDGIILQGYGTSLSTAYVVKDFTSQAMEFLIANNTELYDVKDNFNDAYLLVFSASWCGPSKRFLKEIEAAGITNYSLIDVDTDDDLSLRYSIRNIPTTILVTTDGREIKKWIGYDDEDPGQAKFVNYIHNCPYNIISYRK